MPSWVSSSSTVCCTSAGRAVAVAMMVVASTRVTATAATRRIVLPTATDLSSIDSRRLSVVTLRCSTWFNCWETLQDSSTLLYSTLPVPPSLTRTCVYLNLETLVSLSLTILSAGGNCRWVLDRSVQKNSHNVHLFLYFSSSSSSSFLLFVFVICFFSSVSFLIRFIALSSFDSLLPARSLGECVMCTRVSSSSSRRMPRPCLLVTSGGVLEDLSRSLVRPLDNSGCLRLRLRLRLRQRRRRR